jgi:hypothetical protein
MTRKETIHAVKKQRTNFVLSFVHDKIFSLFYSRVAARSEAAGTSCRSLRRAKMTYLRISGCIDESIQRCQCNCLAISMMKMFLVLELDNSPFHTFSDRNDLFKNHSKCIFKNYINAFSTLRNFSI